MSDRLRTALDLAVSDLENAARTARPGTPNELLASFDLAIKRGRIVLARALLEHFCGCIAREKAKEAALTGGSVNEISLLGLSVPERWWEADESSND